MDKNNLIYNIIQVCNLYYCFITSIVNFMFNTRKKIWTLLYIKYSTTYNNTILILFIMYSVEIRTNSSVLYNIKNDANINSKVIIYFTDALSF